jgi:hypothetical protein
MTKKPKTSRGRRWDSHVGMEPLQTTPPARSAATSRAPEGMPPLQAQQRLESASSSARCRRWSGGGRSRRCGAAAATAVGEGRRAVCVTVRQWRRRLMGRLPHGQELLDLEEVLSCEQRPKEMVATSNRTSALEPAGGCLHPRLRARWRDLHLHPCPEPSSSPTPKPTDATSTRIPSPPAASSRPALEEGGGDGCGG